MSGIFYMPPVDAKLLFKEVYVWSQTEDTTQYFLHSNIWMVLSRDRDQLQEELIFGVLSSDGDLNFERWFVISTTTGAYVSHPLQFVSWKLLHAKPGITTIDRVASDRTG